MLSQRRLYYDDYDRFVPSSPLEEAPCRESVRPRSHLWTVGHARQNADLLSHRYVAPRQGGNKRPVTRSRVSVGVSGCACFMVAKHELVLTLKLLLQRFLFQSRDCTMADLSSRLLSELRLFFVRPSLRLSNS